jgi:hypothetical protein
MGPMPNTAVMLRSPSNSVSPKAPPSSIVAAAAATHPTMAPASPPSMMTNAFIIG